MTDINFFLVKRAECHFSFLKRAGRRQKDAGRSALQKRPWQNTAFPSVRRGGSVGKSAGLVSEVSWVRILVEQLQNFSVCLMK